MKQSQTKAAALNHKKLNNEHKQLKNLVKDAHHAVSKSILSYGSAVSLLAEFEERHHLRGKK